MHRIAPHVAELVRSRTADMKAYIGLSAAHEWFLLVRMPRSTTTCVNRMHIRVHGAGHLPRTLTRMLLMKTAISRPRTARTLRSMVIVSWKFSSLWSTSEPAVDKAE